MASSLWRVASEAYVTVKAVLRYRETLFWVVLFPILWYTLMVAVWGNPEPPTVDIAVYNGDALEGNSTLADALLEAMNSSGLFQLRSCASAECVYDSVRRGEAGAGLIIPWNFTESLLTGSPATLTLVREEGRWGDLASSTLQGFLEAYADRLRREAIQASLSAINSIPGLPENVTSYAARWLRFIEEPVRVEEESVTPQMLATPEGLRAYYAVSMIGVEALFIGLFTGANAVNERKRTGTLAVILSSPMKSWELMAADTLAALAAVAISSAAVTAYSLATGARYEASPENLALAVLLITTGTLFTIGLGLLLAPLAKTPEGANVIVNAIAFPVMFIGGIVIPQFILPDPLRAFAEHWPLSVALETARRTLIGELAPAEALTRITPTIAATIAVYTAGLLSYKKLLAKTIEYH